MKSCAFPAACLLSVSLLFSGVRAAEPPAPSIAAKAWLLMDLTSGQTLSSANAAERFEPASLTKLMTAYVVFTALREKRLALEQTVPVSERASKAGGARMFIQQGVPVAVSELLQGMIVQSAN